MSTNEATIGTPNTEHRTPNTEHHNYTQKLPVRIAHVIGKIRNGGVEAVIMNYYRNIDRTKIHYDLIIDNDSSNPHVQAELESLGGRVITVPPYQKLLANHKALYQIFRQNHYQLVYSHMNTLSVFPLFAAKRAGIPIRVAHSHSTAGHGHGESIRNIMKYSLTKSNGIFSYLSTLNFPSELNMLHILPSSITTQPDLDVYTEDVRATFNINFSIIANF